MSARAIWLLRYDIEAAARERYVQWFHDVHIPEKLARPGYEWAAHYEGDADAHSSRFIAMFGGESTATFLAPNPKQLKTRQDELTKEMMGLRRRGSASILAYEWPTTEGAIATSNLSLALLQSTTEVDDEDIGAACVQQLAPAVANAGVLHKLIGVTGPARHVLLLASHAADVLAGTEQGALYEAMPAVLSDVASASQSGRRIWPL